MTGHSAAGFQPGPLAQQVELHPKAASRAALQSAVGCCGHYLQLGAAHGHCAGSGVRESPEMRKKLILQFFSPGLERRSLFI